MVGKQGEPVAAPFRGYIQQQNWSIIEEKPIQNGLQLIVTNGKTRTPVVCFANGNALIQGPASPLKTQLQTWWNRQKQSQPSSQEEATERSPALQNRIDALREYARMQGWACAGKEIAPDRYQLRLTHETTSVSITFYPQGMIQIQGTSSDLKQQVEQWRNQQSQATNTPLWENRAPLVEKAPEDALLSHPQAIQTNGLAVAHIGTDEAGKGDYFGPLVVAGVYLDEQRSFQLKTLGVRDSKTLSDKVILSLAEEIKQICSPREYTVLSYQPAHYNRLYQEIHNLNTLLARAHAQVIETIQQATGCSFALVDQFSSKALVSQELQRLGCQVTIEQRPRAEDDMAVAAASLLARTVFVQQLAELSKYAGVELPKGASNPVIVEISRTIVTRSGKDMLGRLAKLHFQTTQALFS